MALECNRLPLLDYCNSLRNYTIQKHLCGHWVEQLEQPRSDFGKRKCIIKSLVCAHFGCGPKSKLTPSVLAFGNKSARSFRSMGCSIPNSEPWDRTAIWIKNNALRCEYMSLIYVLNSSYCWQCVVRQFSVSVSKVRAKQSPVKNWSRSLKIRGLLHNVNVPNKSGSHIAKLAIDIIH